MPVTVQRDDGHVAVVLLDRPERLNSLDRAMRDDLQAAWSHLSADPQVRVVVVTGAGDRAFCTGSDLSAGATATETFAVEAFGVGGGDALLKGLDPDLPVIAAVNGLAIGGGFEIALGCDIRIAAPRAEFGLTETRVGSMPGAGGTQLLPRTVGRSLAMQMLLTGERIGAEHALAAGLVSEIADSALDRSLELANLIARNAPLAVRAVKRMVRLGDDAPLSTALQLERLAFGLIKSTDDRREGRTAFTERRTPNYTGE